MRYPVKSRLSGWTIIDICAIGLAAILLITFLLMPTQRAPHTIYPPSLRPGDRIAIISPSGPVDSAAVDSAMIVLRELGFNPVCYPYALGRNGHFSGTHDQRLSDLKRALTDPDVRAILCARGGYGAVHSLDSLRNLPIAENPKWLIGFSDISALHALFQSKGVASIHASMAKHIVLGADDIDNATLLDILAGKFPTYTFQATPFNHTGHAEGVLVGGNLAVIQALIGTDMDIINREGTILFIEDVAEPIYKIERQLYQMRLMGVFDRINGLIIGQFTEYNPDDNHETMEQMIAEALAPYPHLPVAFNAPVGHVDHNVPLVEGAYATLDITPTTVTLKLEK